MADAQQTEVGTPQFDLQGLIGALIASAAGRAVGQRIGGSTGKLVGGIAGTAAGSFFPLSAEPQAAPSDQQPTDLELQGFWRELIAKAPQAVALSRKAIDIANQLRPMQADPLSQPDQQPTDLELQGFWNVTRKLIAKAPQAVALSRRAIDIANQLRPMQADPLSQPDQQPTDLELQGFWNVTRKLIAQISPVNLQAVRDVLQ